MKHSLPPYLGQHCSFVFTFDNDEVIFKGKFVNPATDSDLLVAGKANLRTPFCIHFSDEECKRYSTTQATKTVKLSHKTDLIAAIIARVSISRYAWFRFSRSSPSAASIIQRDNQNCASG